MNSYVPFSKRIWHFLEFRSKIFCIMHIWAYKDKGVQKLKRERDIGPFADSKNVVPMQTRNVWSNIAAASEVIARPCTLKKKSKVADDDRLFLSAVKCCNNKQVL